MIYDSNEETVLFQFQKQIQTKIHETLKELVKPRNIRTALWNSTF